MITVSVVMPAYNQGRFLAQAIESVLGQRGCAVEAVVVDDGSTDDTPEILRSFGTRIRHLRQDHAGVSAARNLGLAEARGEAVLFLDSDDLLGEDALASQAALLESRPGVDMAVCRNRIFKNLDAGGAPEIFDEWPLFRSDHDVHICHFNVAPIHAFLCRRKVVEAVGAFDTALAGCEDHDYWLRALTLGCSIAPNPGATVYYRKHPESASTDASRLYGFDAKLQLRISGVLDAHPRFPAKRREGLLANAAGSVLTALRIFEDDQDTARTLLAVALKRIAQAGSIREGGDQRLSSYFLHRLLSFVVGRRPDRLDPKGRLKAALAGLLERNPELVPGFPDVADPAAVALDLAAAMY